MKRYFLHLLILMLITSGWNPVLMAQSFTISVEGQVTDILTGSPIASQEVEIEIFGSGISENYLLSTNDSGFYFMDSIPVINNGSIKATTYDCNGDSHILQDNFSPVQMNFIFDFVICADTVSPCKANFNYSPVPGSYFTLAFSDISTGSPNQWQWDFGDGNASTQQNPVHTFNSFGPFDVCLTIWAANGTYSDSVCKEVMIDTTQVNCTNWFTYETPDQTTYTFMGDAAPPADLYFWDFGDGSTGTSFLVEHTYTLSNQYVTVLLTTLSFDPINNDSCIAVSSQQIWVSGQGPDCTNEFEYITNDGYTFEFSGFSMPEANLYSWDFGDGDTDTGPLVTHTYSAGTNGEIPVKLTTYHYSPAGGDSCIAVSSQMINVGGGLNCDAFYTWSMVPGNLFTVQFTDGSAGPVNSWNWDFGDGNSSNLTNPSHTFSSSGVYNVCLEIASDSLGFFCSDTYCETIQIDFSLSAGFTYFLDTISGDTAKYFFQDSSIGEPDSWSWDFGDGLGSTIPNPVHQFNQGFSTEVCLTVSRNIPNAGVISDSHCEDLQTPSYYHLGGILFLDNYPINNQSGDTTVVDTGHAWLYRKYGNTLVPVDTTSFYEYGFYFFQHVREGDYVVKSGLTPGSQHFEEWLPAYYQNAAKWQDAASISLIGGNSIDKNINMVPLGGIAQGPGMINGFVSSTSSGILTNEQLKGIDVMLFNDSGVLLSYDKTQPGGTFGFQGLALGTYTLYAEAAGLFTTPHTISIDDGAPPPMVSLELFEENVGTEEYSKCNNCVGDTYPNPAGNTVFIDICRAETSINKLIIYDVRGNVLRTLTEINVSDNARVSVNVQDFPPGLYFIKLVNIENKTITARKFVK